MQGWERVIYTLSEDHSPTMPTNIKKELNMKTAEDKKGESSKANKKTLTMLLELASPKLSNTGTARSFHRDTERRDTARFCS